MVDKPFYAAKASKNIIIKNNCGIFIPGKVGIQLFQPFQLLETDGSFANEKAEQANVLKMYQEQTRPNEYFPPKKIVKFKSLDPAQNG